MNMVDLLPPIAQAIGDQSITTTQSFGGSHLPGDADNPPHDRFMSLIEVIESSEMNFGNQQQVTGRHRIDIPEAIYQVVFVNLLRRDLAGDDFTKQTI